MDTTVNVRVQIKGHAAGTSGWLAAILNDSELVIRKTRHGIPGMFLHEKHDATGDVRKDNEGNIFICRPAMGNQSDEDYEFTKINEIEYVSTHATSRAMIYGGGFDISFTQYPLTPACKKALEQFLAEAVRKFAVWYEVQ